MIVNGAILFNFCVQKIELLGSQYQMQQEMHNEQSETIHADQLNTATPKEMPLAIEFGYRKYMEFRHQDRMFRCVAKINGIECDNLSVYYKAQSRNTRHYCPQHAPADAIRSSRFCTVHECTLRAKYVGKTLSKFCLLHLPTDQDKPIAEKPNPVGAVASSQIRETVAPAENSHSAADRLVRAAKNLSSIASTIDFIIQRRNEIVAHLSKMQFLIHQFAGVGGQTRSDLMFSTPAYPLLIKINVFEHHSIAESEKQHTSDYYKSIMKAADMNFCNVIVIDLAKLYRTSPILLTTKFESSLLSYLAIFVSRFVRKNTKILHIYMDSEYSMKIIGNMEFA